MHSTSNDSHIPPVSASSNTAVSNGSPAVESVHTQSASRDTRRSRSHGREKNAEET